MTGTITSGAGGETTPYIQEMASITQAHVPLFLRTTPKLQFWGAVQINQRCILVEWQSRETAKHGTHFSLPLPPRGVGDCMQVSCMQGMCVTAEPHPWPQYPKHQNIAFWRSIVFEGFLQV